jgi:phosphoglycerate dehydrogenase-like enzyme
MIKSAIFNNQVKFYDGDIMEYVYALGRRKKIAEITDLYPQVITSANFAEHAGRLKDVQVIFSTWGMPPLDKEQIRQLPSLKAVFYAAGSAKGFAKPFMDSGVKVSSAWLANAIPVAEFCLGQILLASKGYFRNMADCRDPAKNNQKTAFTGKGMFDIEIALIGAGAISEKLQELLKTFAVKVSVVPSRKERRTISLEEAFEKSYIVSNHLPDRDDNKGVLNYDLFRRMPHGATFINTGRGAQVNEDDLVKVLRERPDLTALLDVTYPEPALPDSEFYKLPNVHISTHIGGSVNNEVVRMADYMIDEFQRWEKDLALKYEVTPENL